MNAAQAISRVMDMEHKINALMKTREAIKESMFAESEWLRIICEEIEKEREKLLDVLWKTEIDYE